MDNQHAVSNLEKQYLEPREQEPVMYDYAGNEIYRGESYIEFENGDKVLNMEFALREYLMNKWKDLLDGAFVERTAE